MDKDSGGPQSMGHKGSDTTKRLTHTKGFQDKNVRELLIQGTEKAKLRWKVTEVLGTSRVHQNS